jgi:hypothetical protein
MTFQGAINCYHGLYLRRECRLENADMLCLLLTCFADILYLLLTCFTFQRAMNCYLGGINGECADWQIAGICVLILPYVSS